jgi:phage I-like protein
MTLICADDLRSRRGWRSGRFAIAGGRISSACQVSLQFVIHAPMTIKDQERSSSLSAAELIARAEAEGLALHASLSALPKGTEAPEWITVFPKGGKIETRDERQFDIDVEKLMTVFRTDGLEIPVDVNHSTDAGIFGGGRSDAVGWVTELRVSASGGLEGRVEWLDEGSALLRGRKYRYTSPSFYRDQFGKATRLKAVALVTAPALARQPALASAQTSTENPMKQLAETLGLSAGAGEAECLSALASLKTGMVPKAEHDTAIANLNAAATELAELKAATRKAKVDGLIEEALAAKKILPVEKDDYIALCATDDGLAHVEKLFATKAAILTGSGLDQRSQPGSGKVDVTDAAKLGAAASAYMAEQAAKGITISAADAVRHLTGEAA